MTTKEKIIKAFTLGFMVSREGFNGECDYEHCSDGFEPEYGTEEAFFAHMTENEEFQRLTTTCLEQIEADESDEQTAINTMFDAFIRLKKLGWREACYCPKDGTPFKVIEPGSTGIHDCTYDGNWPDGAYWILTDGDASPSHPILFKPNS